MQNVYRRLSKYLFPLISIFIVAGFVLAQVFAFLPAKQIFNAKTRNTLDTVGVFTVQGWAFFTRSPREEQVVPYKYDADSGAWYQAVRGPNTQLRYVFGLNRESRLSEYDVQILLEDSSDLVWAECSDVSDLDACVAEIPITEKKISADNFELCGDVVLVNSSAVPWAYRNVRSGMPGEVVRINAVCEATT